MVIFLTGNKVHLTRGEKMNAVALDLKRFEIDHVRASAIHKNADFIIIVTMRLFCPMRIVPVANGFAHDLIYMKSNVFIPFGQFVDVDIFEQVTERFKPNIKRNY